MVSYDEAKVPKILYKYRDWSNDYHKKLLYDPSVYLSAPSDFEDILDCKNPVRFDLLTGFEIFDRYFNDSLKENKGFNYMQHFQWAGEWFKRSPIHNSTLLKQIQLENANDFDKIIGVLSLTADNSNAKMWEKYANNNKGFCLGYNSKILFNFLGGGSEVLYRDVLPIIKPYDSFESIYHKQIYYKESKWSFEKEYRTLKIWPDYVLKSGRNIMITNECISEIILGSAMPLGHIQEIEYILKSKMPHVKIIYN